jgi:hypothetical protein
MRFLMEEEVVGANSEQGVAVLVFLLAFTCLGWGMYLEGNILLLLGFVVGLGASIALFLKAKPLENAK